MGIIGDPDGPTTIRLLIVMEGRKLRLEGPIDNPALCDWIYQQAQARILEINGLSTPTNGTTATVGAPLPKTDPNDTGNRWMGKGDCPTCNAPSGWDHKPKCPNGITPPDLALQRATEANAKGFREIGCDDQGNPLPLKGVKS